jgi:hypothetical protein
MMGSVRPFTAHDIPQVARLHQMVFPAGAGEPREPAAYEAYFRSVFLENPAGDAALPSLVYEGAGGRIVGFLGSVRRRMAMGHRRYEAAVSSQFIVDPSAPTGLVAVHLVKAFLEGPQDLSIADEATDTARRIWEGLGGTNSLINSLHWTRPLRPARLAMSFIRERPRLAPFAAAARPFTSALDTLATRVPGSHFRQIACADGAEEVCADAMAACAPDLHGDGRLRVEYDARTVEWLLDRAGNRRGRVLKAAFRNGQTITGWYVCHLDAAGHAEAIQLAATPSSVGGVLDHLFYQAWRHGAIAVSGRLDGRVAQALSDRYCLFHRRGPWMLINANKPELLASFYTGNSAFSRMDGEWSLRF